MSFTQRVAGAAANRKDDKGQLSVLTYFTVDWLHWPVHCSCRRVQIEPAAERTAQVNWDQLAAGDRSVSNRSPGRRRLSEILRRLHVRCSMLPASVRRSLATVISPGTQPALFPFALFCG